MMSQSLVNEVKRLRAEINQLSHELQAAFRNIEQLREHIEYNYQRKRGPKPSERENGKTEATV